MPTQRATSAPFLVIIAALLLAFALTAGYAWRDKSATFDEPLHFSAAWLQTHYADFRCDPQDPPLWDYYVMLGNHKDQLKISTSGLIWDTMLTNRGIEGLFFKQVFYYTPGNDAVGMLVSARIRMLILGVILGAGIAWWAWRLHGPVAAAISVAAFSFDPNFLAHSPLVKNDVPIALAFLAFMIALWGVGKRATLVRCAALSLAMGVAMTIKFSGVLTIPILLLALAARALLPEPWTYLKWIAQTRARRIAVAAAITFASCAFSYIFIWGCYYFRYGPSADPTKLFDFGELLRIAARHEAFGFYNAFTITSQQLQQWNDNWKPGALFRALLWIGKHRLMPQSWVVGFLFTYGTAPGREAFLLGTSAMTGRWYYFPVVIAVKSPVATLAGLVLATVYWFSRRWSAARIWDILALAIAPLIYLAIAMHSDLNLGIRHILPIYPFLFIFLGITTAEALRRFRKPAMVIVSLLLLGLVVETYAAFPDYIPFFNIAAGGWKNGPRLLGDSNVDWGQDLPALAEWQQNNPQYQLYLNYFGSADPRYYRIHYINLPGSQAPEDETAQDFKPSIYAISGNAPHFPWLSPEARKLYANLQSHPPVAVLGHCIYLYNPP